VSPAIALSSFLSFYRRLLTHSHGRGNLCATAPVLRGNDGALRACEAVHEIARAVQTGLGGTVRAEYTLP
jgi:hypothetical protein